LGGLTPNSPDLLNLSYCNVYSFQLDDTSADESYYLGEKQEHPDLAIEVNIISGSPQKLDKYQRLGIREVWIWQAEKLVIYTLEGDRYQKTPTSKLLPNLDIALLEECVMMPSRLEAIQRFTTR
jgi:Uma2 family endonuclease